MRAILGYWKGFSRKHLTLINVLIAAVTIQAGAVCYLWYWVGKDIHDASWLAWQNQREIAELERDIDEIKGYINGIRDCADTWSDDPYRFRNCVRRELPSMIY
jgi:hypothetical protein